MVCAEVAMMFFMLGAGTGALGLALAEAYRIGMMPKVVTRGSSPYFDEQEWFNV